MDDKEMVSTFAFNIVLQWGNFLWNLPRFLLLCVFVDI